MPRMALWITLCLLAGCSASQVYLEAEHRDLFCKTTIKLEVSHEGRSDVLCRRDGSERGL